MAYFTFEEKQVYYETYGDGEPLLLLNGIMMSCASWANYIEPFSRFYKLILVDFLDQGKSDCYETEYDHSVQVRLVNALLVHLNVSKVILVGYSYGGYIALQYAIAKPEHVSRLMLFNATASYGEWLRDVGHSWNLAVDNPAQYYYTTIPVIYSPYFYKTHNDWMENRRIALEPLFSNQRWLDGMVRLTNSSENYDVRDQLCRIHCPTLIVSSEQDYLIPLAEQEYLAEHILDSHHVIIPNCGHASMYERPSLFASLILGFAGLGPANLDCFD